jgi:hypothetical protein
MRQDDTLIPADLLQKSDKILFIAHLALGDFTYLQNFFRLCRAEPAYEDSTCGSTKYGAPQMPASGRT